MNGTAEKVCSSKKISFHLVGMFLATLSGVFVFPLSTWVKPRPLTEGEGEDLKLLQKFVIKYFIFIAKQLIRIMLIPNKYSDVYEERC